MKSEKYYSQKQEQRVAEDIKGKTVIASGSLWGSKGDVRNEHFLIECKRTNKDYYSFNVNTWNKIFREAVKDGLRIPVMIVETAKSKIAIIQDKTLTIETFGLELINQSYRIREEEKFLPYIIESSRISGNRLVLLPYDMFIESIEEVEEWL